MNQFNHPITNFIHQILTLTPEYLLPLTPVIQSHLDALSPTETKNLINGFINQPFSPHQATNLAYLLYEFKNPTTDIPEIVSQILQTIHIKPEQDIFHNFARILNEWVLAAVELNHAWSYIRQIDAKHFIELLFTEKIGPKLIADLTYFAQTNLLLAPPQIISLIKQYNSNTNTANWFYTLIELYQSDQSLRQIFEREGLNYHITGLQRAFEYQTIPPIQQLQSSVLSSPKLPKNNCVLSFGGALGLIEASRIEALVPNSPPQIFAIDKASKEELLKTTLVIKDELTFKQYNLADQRYVETLHNQYPNLHHLTLTLPQPPEVIRNHIQKQLGNSPFISGIYDQRATVLYLSGFERYQTIQSAIELLTDSAEIHQHPNFYILSRTWADQPILDLAMEITPDKSVTIKHIITTNHIDRHSSPFLFSATTAAKRLQSWRLQLDHQPPLYVHLKS